MKATGKTKIFSIAGFDFVMEYKFHPVRKWRFDYALLEHKIAIEIEGGIWNNGAHVRGKHYSSDMEKYNQAQILGWKVLRYTHEQFNQYTFLNDIYNIIKI